MFYVTGEAHTERLIYEKTLNHHEKAAPWCQFFDGRMVLIARVLQIYFNKLTYLDVGMSNN